MIIYKQDNWKHTFFLFFAWKGSVYRSIYVDIILFTAWGALVAIVGTTSRSESIEDGIGIPTTMHSMAAVALGFLLVFRAQVAYARYWDARSIFSSLATNCRDIGLQLASYIDRSGAEVARVRNQVMRFVGAYVALVAHYLQTHGVIEDYSFLEPWLTESEINKLKGLPGLKPVHLALWLRNEITGLERAGYLSRVHIRVIDPKVSMLLQDFHLLHRILFTPVPFPYVQMLQVALLLYFIFLPPAFLPLLGTVTKTRWQLPLIMGIFTFVFYGLKNLSWELEEPFGIDDNKLPLLSLAAGVEEDIRLFLGDERIVGPLPPGYDPDAPLVRGVAPEGGEEDQGAGEAGEKPSAPKLAKVAMQLRASRLLLH
eukprot:tig00000140_g8466.t1